MVGVNFGEPAPGNAINVYDTDGELEKTIAATSRKVKRWTDTRVGFALEGEPGERYLVSLTIDGGTNKRPVRLR